SDLWLLDMLLVAVVAAGCNTGAVQEEDIAVPQQSGIEQAKQILQNYANGAPITSEAASFPNIVEQVRQEDPAKADLLEKGFADLQANPEGRVAKAKELLEKL